MIIQHWTHTEPTTIDLLTWVSFSCERSNSSVNIKWYRNKEMNFELLNSKFHHASCLGICNTVLRVLRKWIFPHSFNPPLLFIRQQFPVCSQHFAPPCVPYLNALCSWICSWIKQIKSFLMKTVKAWDCMTSMECDLQFLAEVGFSSGVRVFSQWYR